MTYIVIPVSFQTYFSSINYAPKMIQTELNY